MTRVWRWVCATLDLVRWVQLGGYRWWFVVKLERKEHDENYSKSAFVVTTTVPWYVTTKRYQTVIAWRHNSTKPGHRYRWYHDVGTIEIESLVLSGDNRPITVWILWYPLLLFIPMSYSTSFLLSLPSSSLFNDVEMQDEQKSVVFKHSISLATLSSNLFCCDHF